MVLYNIAMCLHLTSRRARLTPGAIAVAGGAILFQVVVCALIAWANRVAANRLEKTLQNLPATPAP
jgi:hypothetical protein